MILGILFQEYQSKGIRNIKQLSEMSQGSFYIEIALGHFGLYHQKYIL